MAGAGHPPPFVLRDGRAETVALAGPLLGAFEDASWVEADLELAPGQSIVLYTDGVTDTTNAGERFGDERLGDVLAAAAHLSPDAIATRVDAALLAFEAGPQRDDVALLVLQATAGDGAAAPGNVRRLRQHRHRAIDEPRGRRCHPPRANAAAVPVLLRQRALPA